MGIHHGVSKKDKPDKRIFEVYQKFFFRSNEKEDGDEAVQNKTLRSVHFGVVVVELINCKCGGIVRNQIWQE